MTRIANWVIYIAHMYIILMTQLLKRGLNNEYVRSALDMDGHLRGESAKQQPDYMVLIHSYFFKFDYFA